MEKFTHLLVPHCSGLAAEQTTQRGTDLPEEGCLQTAGQKFPFLTKSSACCRMQKSPSPWHGRTDTAPLPRDAVGDSSSSAECWGVTRSRDRSRVCASPDHCKEIPVCVIQPHQFWYRKTSTANVTSCNFPYLNIIL